MATEQTRLGHPELSAQSAGGPYKQMQGSTMWGWPWGKVSISKGFIKNFDNSAALKSSGSYQPRSPSTLGGLTRTSNAGGVFAGGGEP